MIYKDRAEAGRLLAQRLQNYRGKNPLIVAIPRGAVPMAKIVAVALGGELDVVLVHKLGHSMNPEYAIGAVDEQGNIQGGAELFTDREFLAQQVKEQVTRLKTRRELYTPRRLRIDPKDRIVIIVDDGIATGWTLKAAIKALRADSPKLIVAAFAVGPHSSIAEIQKLADVVICPNQPDDFSAVGQFFADFSQVTDQEVIDILNSKN